MTIVIDQLFIMTVVIQWNNSLKSKYFIVVMCNIEYRPRFVFDLAW